MAGYLFLIDKKQPEALEECMKYGVYSTVIKSAPNGIWHLAYEATFADYISMKAGDNVYFFSDRKIYGVGELIEIGGACKYKNYPSASQPLPHKYSAIKKDLLYDNGSGSEKMRWLCMFKPYPSFFKEGVDMDELLSYSPDKIRMIRTIQNVSFIKLDDEENKAVRDCIVFKNRKCLSEKKQIYPFNDKVHKKIHKLASVSPLYTMTALEIMDCCVNKDGTLRHEMALECGILELISNASEEEIFGRWNYVSHQVMASPFKPLAYADKMDVFGYNYIYEVRDKFDTISDFLIIEIKAGGADENCVEQTLKYVEWVKQEYAQGDYSRIKAFLVASGFDKAAKDAKASSAIRHYTKGGRPPKTAMWNDLTLITYKYSSKLRKLQISKVN